MKQTTHRALLLAAALAGAMQLDMQPLFFERNVGFYVRSSRIRVNY